LNQRRRSALSLKETRKKNISIFIHLNKLSYRKETKDKNISGNVARIRERKSLNLCSEILSGG
jgi:hypothetical protein